MRYARSQRRVSDVRGTRLMTVAVAVAVAACRSCRSRSSTGRPTRARVPQRGERIHRLTQHRYAGQQAAAASPTSSPSAASRAIGVVTPELQQSRQVARLRVGRRQPLAVLVLAFVRQQQVELLIWNRVAYLARLAT